MEQKNFRHSLKAKKFFIFDMDGTIYLGDTPLPHAADLLWRLYRDGSRRFIYFTNNASKSPAVYLDKLSRLGFPAAPELILTSADVTARFLLTQRSGMPVYLLGTPALAEMFRSLGIILFEPDFTRQYDQNSPVPPVVVTSFDTTLTYGRLERACTYIRRGAEWLTTHPDINCPVEGGYIPDCGAMNELIRLSAGRASLPISFGKPSPETIALICSIYGANPEEMAIFGDRLYTDIALGKNTGVTAALMLTGEATGEEARALPDELRPDRIYAGMGEVTEEIYGSE